MSSTGVDAMSKMLKDLVKQVKELTKANMDLNDKVELLSSQVVKLNETNERVGVETNASYRALSERFDQSFNLERSSAESIQATQATSARATKITPSSFFKNLVKGKIDEYVDKLYSSDDVAAVSSDERVAKLKSEAQKNTRIVSLLYTEYVKPNKDRMKVLDGIINSEQK